MTNVIVTGASRGIGMATALAFARSGCNVAAAVRNLESAKELISIATNEKLSIVAYKMDVTIDESVVDAIAKINNEIGPIDVLVNNAGIDRLGAVEEVSLNDFRSVMETNCFGAIRCAQAVLPQCA